jgi:hypothetical protein
MKLQLIFMWVATAIMLDAIWGQYSPTQNQRENKLISGVLFAAIMIVTVIALTYSD